MLFSQSGYFEQQTRPVVGFRDLNGLGETGVQHSVQYEILINLKPILLDSRCWANRIYFDGAGNQ